MKKITTLLLLLTLAITTCAACAKEEVVESEEPTIVVEDTAEPEEPALNDESMTSEADNQNVEGAPLNPSEIDADYLDEIGIVAGAKYVFTQRSGHEAYFLFNEDGTVIEHVYDNEGGNGQYYDDVRNYIVKDDKVYVRGAQHPGYDVYDIQENGRVLYSSSSDTSLIRE